MARPVQQIKIFKGIDSELPEFEKQINRFIRKNDIKVLQITGNLSPSSGESGGPLHAFTASEVMVVILYEIERTPDPLAKPD